MHRVPDRLVPKGAQVEVGAEFAVEPRQQVQVELGCDAGSVVVGGEKRWNLLDQVDAEQQPVARAVGGRRGDLAPRFRPRRRRSGC